METIRLLVACDKFRGSLTAKEANEAILAGLAASGLAAEAEARPLADGGEGTVAAFAAAVAGRTLEVPVRDAFGRPATAPVFLAADGALAVVEAASAAGHDPAGRTAPDGATSFGLGEAIRAVLEAGARHVVVGLGGSITVDGGAGLLEALGARFTGADGQPLERPAGRGLSAIAGADLSGLDPRLSGARIEVASDVDNPLLGPRGAAAVFGPQKGVAPGDVAAFDAALAHLDAVLSAATGRPSVAGAPAAGAAGGMLVGLSAAGRPVVREGFACIAERTGLFEALDRADLVVTGEGSLDGQSLGGKGPVALARRAAARGRPAIAFAGRLDAPREALAAAGIRAAFPLPSGPVSLEEALTDAAPLLAERAAHVFSLVAAARGLIRCDQPRGRTA